MKLKYKYALANVWWNKNAQDQPLFRNINLMNEYFENVRTPWGDLSNFVIKDGVETDTYIRVPETMSINEVLNYHYLLVQEIDEETNEPIRTLHYFAEISQDSGNQYYCMLERDIIIDYYILGNVRDKKYTMIYRAHLDRFVYEDDKFKFNGGNDSPLYIKEDIDADTPLCSQISNINLQYSKENGEGVKDYSNIWLYVYLKLPSSNANYNPYYEGDINMGYTLLCFPFNYYENLSTAHNILKNGDSSYRWNFNDFIEQNTSLVPYIVNIRLSLTCPFGSLENSLYCNYSREQVGLSINLIYDISGVGTTYKIIETNGYAGLIVCSGLYAIENQNVYDTVSNILTLDNFPSLTKDYIRTSKKYEKEPKIYNGIIKSKINFFNSEGNEYNLLSLLYSKDDDALYMIHESLCAGITRFYHGLIINNTNTIYNGKNFLSLQQNNVSIDTSIPFSVDQYETFLAQNKNFYQSTKLARDYNLTKKLTNSIFGFFGGLLSKNPLSALQSLVNGGFAGGDYAVDYKQQEYQMDNLKNAPTDIHNLDGNIGILLPFMPLQIRFEIWQPLQSNLEKIADYLFFNGYTYNKLGKLSDFDNTRKYFNFVQGDINGLCYNMNEKGYKLLREKLLNGIRFWHEEPCNINFEQYDNYETWIDNIE